MAKQTLSDAELMFSAAQIIADSAANTASTNEIDLGSTAMGEGVVVKGVVNVTTLTGTLVVKVGHKSTASVAVTDNPYYAYNNCIRRNRAVLFCTPAEC